MPEDVAVSPQGREPVMPYYIAVTSYISFALMFLFGHARDAWRLLAGSGTGGTAPPPGYAPLCKDYEDFYTRRLYMRIHDVFNRPIASAPDAWVDVVEREPEPGGRPSARRLRCTDATRRCLNLGSYNYLGFAAADPYCTQRVRGPCLPGQKREPLAARRTAASRLSPGPCALRDGDAAAARRQTRHRGAPSAVWARRVGFKKRTPLTCPAAPPRGLARRAPGAGLAGKVRREHLQARAPPAHAQPRGVRARATPTLALLACARRPRHTLPPPR
jgi:hypothetical protein